MQIKIVRSRKDKKLSTVELSVPPQYFRLDYHASKKECKWMAKMFRKALTRDKN